MSQKLGFPYFGTSSNTWIFFVGFILSILVFLFIGASLPAAAVGVLEFFGVFLTGWALIGYAVNKDMLEGQRFIAILFALLMLTGLFAVYLVHPIGITFGVS